MPAYTIPSAVAAFIESHVTSVDEIELLIALIDAPDRWWDPPLVSSELGILQPAARAMLDGFAAANLLDIRVTGDVRYRFRPGTRELHDTAAAFADAYRSHPAAIVQMVAQSARRSVRDFAEAFRFKRHGRR